MNALTLFQYKEAKKMGRHVAPYDYKCLGYVCSKCRQSVSERKLMINSLVSDLLGKKSNFCWSFPKSAKNKCLVSYVIMTPEKHGRMSNKSHLRVDHFFGDAKDKEENATLGVRYFSTLRARCSHLRPPQVSGRLQESRHATLQSDHLLVFWKEDDE